jgi:hypothetical protein
MTMGRRRADESGPRWTGPTDADARQVQRGLVEEVRREAANRGLQWTALLDRAGLSKASRSRLNAGIAGISTIGRVRRAMDELTASNSPPPTEREETPTRSRRYVDQAASPDRRKRWVVVQRKDRQMFVGIVSETDDEIADKGRVRLERCRPILSVDASAASLAAVGPSERGTAGPEAPSALVLDVAVVYDATKAAIRAFESRK